MPYIFKKHIISASKHFKECCCIMETHYWSPIQCQILRSGQCSEHRKVILVVHLLQFYGDVIYCLKDQFPPVIMRYDMALRGEAVCVERRSKGVTVNL